VLWAHDNRAGELGEEGLGRIASLAGLVRRADGIHRPAREAESLTATERAVSLLVARRLTNGALARRLYISPHTVNTHLRHVHHSIE
jgi:DNA-binding CsgD family transcriptional regulator